MKTISDPSSAISRDWKPSLLTKQKSKIRCDETLNRSKGASHCGWRCHLQVHGLKDEAHLRRHLNDLTAHQTQLLVVVEHCVHILNPHGVYWAVKDKPLSVRALREGRHRIAYTLKEYLQHNL